MSLLPTVNARGLLAARPAAVAANEGYNYYVTDTGILYRSNGASWDVNSSGFTNPMTTQGDIIYGGASGSPTRFPIGVAGRVLTVNAGATAPEWAAAAGGGGTPAFVGAKAYHTVVQSIPTAVTTGLLLDSEEFDTTAFHDLTTNNSRFTVPAGKAGYYLLQGGTSGVAVGQATSELLFLKNGATLIRSATSAQGSGNGPWVTTSAIELLAVADYVELAVYQASGSARNVGSAAGSDNQSWASVALLGT